MAATPFARLALLLAVAAVAGAGTMVVELAAVRLLAPWFGTSQVVWTNVIGVVLLALALGYAAGGRLSARGAPLQALGLVLAVAALTTASLPTFAPWVTDLFLPRELALQDASGVLHWSSLAAACLLFLPPATLLGMVAPLAVQAVQELAGHGAGRSGGLVLSASTLGSLAGVFGTGHLLLPRLGVAGTHAAAAAALGVAALLALILAGRPGRRSAAVLVLLAGAGLAAARGGGRPPRLGDEERLLGAVETAYQSVRVVEDRSWDPPLRSLQVNEGFDSFQSVWQPEPGLLPDGFYYNAFALPACWSRASGTWRLLVLGLGGGTVFRVLDGASPPGLAWERVGVELDAGVVRLGREHLDLPEDDARTQVLAGLDARAALRALRGSFDYVVLDAFSNQVEVPAHLATREFFGQVRERLVEGGWLGVNVGGFGFDDPVVAAIARTVATAFGGESLVLRVPSSRNFVVFARRDAALPLVAGPGGGPDRLAAAGPPMERWLEALRLPGGWRRMRAAEGPGLVLRDGFAPTEWLQERSLAGARERLLDAGGRP